MTLESTRWMIDLLKRDRRYKPHAYTFVFEALHYAQTVLELGAEKPSEPAATPPDEEEPESESESPQRHVTGQELCEAIRQYSLEMYGYMSKTVLNSWGIHTTGDFGAIVFNLIEIGKMRKTADDCREDFENVYDFDEAFERGFKITLPD